MGVTENWQEVDQAIKNGSLFKADLKTLERYLQFVSNPPPSDNPAFHAKLSQAAGTIRHLISEKQNERTLRWAKAAAVAAIVGVVLMLIQLF